MLNVPIKWHCVYVFLSLYTYIQIYSDYLVTELALLHEFRMQHEHNHQYICVYWFGLKRFSHTFTVTQQEIDVFTAVNSFGRRLLTILYIRLTGEHRIKFTNKWICPLSTSYSEIYARTHERTRTHNFVSLPGSLYSKCSHKMNSHEFLSVENSMLNRTRAIHNYFVFRMIKRKFTNPKHVCQSPNFK